MFAVRGGSQISRSSSRISIPRIAQIQSHLRASTTAQHLALSTTAKMTMASIPQTMRGIIIEKTGGVEVLQYKTDLPVPTPQEGEILVKNEFIGLNFIDTYYRSGLYPYPLPSIIGSEAEGTVVALGPGSDGKASPFAVGQRTAFMKDGAYAEYTAMPVSKAYKVPDGIPPGIAAASLLQGLTALTMIRETYHVQKGDWVLVHAAAGGVGLWLCQLLKAVGARVIGTASTAEKIALAKENGAEFMINYKEVTDLKEKIREIAGGEGVHAVFDGVGKDMFELDLEVLRRKGTLVSFGNASGPVPPFTIARLGAQNLKIARPRLFAYLVTEEERETFSSDLWDFILKDQVKVKIHETYPLEDAARAQSDLEGRKSSGKLLLKP